MRKLGAVVIFGLLAVAMGCGSSSSSQSPTGGKGGTSATGGNNMGGTSATGGSNTGGTSATGGSSTGGSSTGGTSATGGSNTGGTSATGGSDTGGTSATGGSSTGGTSATGGSSTGGGTGTSACSMPSCLKNLASDCAESGACTTQTDSATGSSNTCYANGVKEINVHDVQTDDRALTVKKGTTTCFTTAFNGNDVYVGMGSITVKNASGTTVASVRLDDQDNLYKVTCTGTQEVSLDASCKSVWPLVALMGTDGGCADGTCSP